MTWPTVAVVTTNLGAAADSPASARSDLLDAVQKLNQQIAHVSTFMATVLDDVSDTAARATLGAAKSGANTDITSLSAPALGAATATTAAASDSDTSVATTAFVQGELTSQAVKLTGAQTVAGVKTFSSQPVLPQALTLATAQNTTSGASIDFTGIPSWAKRVSVVLNGVSTNGTNRIQIQLGSGSIQTSGYTGQSANPGGTTSTFSSAFVVNENVTTPDARSGIVTLILVSGNIWVESGIVSSASASTPTSSGGTVTLSGALDRVRLTTVGGTDTFDAGSVNILYE